MPDNNLIIYRYSLEWSIFDSVGNKIKESSKLFESKSEAQKYAQTLKKNTPQENNIIVNLRKLENNEIVEQYKKSAGSLNYRRRFR